MNAFWVVYEVEGFEGKRQAGPYSMVAADEHERDLGDENGPDPKWSPEGSKT